MSSPAAAVPLSRRLSFATADGSRTLVGALDSAASAQRSSSGNRCALLCHGMLASGQEWFFPALAQALLAPSASSSSSASASPALENEAARKQQQTTKTGDDADGAGAEGTDGGADGAGGEELFCVCRQPYDAALPMIGCDKCDGWFHARCFPISVALAQLNSFICPSCRKSEAQTNKEQQAAEPQTDDPVLASSASSSSSASATAAPPVVDHVFRIDFSGHAGASTGGHFSYGGYARLVEEIEETVRFLQREQRFNVDLLVGHSMGANAVFLYAAKHCASAAAADASSSPSPLRIPRVIAISPRFDMSVDHRFSKTELLGLLKDGVMQLRRGQGKAPLPITLEQYQTRLRLDMTCVRHIDAAVAHTLLLHGGEDVVIPQRDSFRMHHWLAAKCEEPESGPLPVARESTCKPTIDLMDRGASSPLSPAADFSPPMAASLPHTFVPIPGVTHLYDTAREAAVVSALVCTWARLHSEFAESATSASAASALSSEAAAGAKAQGAKL